MVSGRITNQIEIEKSAGALRTKRVARESRERPLVSLPSPPPISLTQFLKVYLSIPSNIPIPVGCIFIKPVETELSLDDHFWDVRPVKGWPGCTTAFATVRVTTSCAAKSTLEQSPPAHWIYTGDIGFVQVSKATSSDCSEQN